MLAVTLFSKTMTVEQLYFKLRDMLATAVDDLRHEALSFAKLEATHSYQHPRNLNAVICAGKTIGEIGVVHPVISKNIDKKAAIVYAEIDIAALSAIDNASISYEEPSRFPGIEIDLSFVTETFAPVSEAITAANCPLVKKVSVIDTYAGENGKSITTRILFAHPEKTLTREEVMGVVDSIIASLEAKGIMLKK